MMAGTLRVRRSRGALSGSLLVLLGVWGALIPFIGPYFNYAYTPDRAWTATSGRMWLDVLPGVVTLAGGLVVLLSRFRPAVLFGSWIAALAGAWFAVGDLIAGHWAGLPAPGTPVGSAARSALEQLGFFTGLGVAIVFVAALALGRFTVVGVADAAASSAGSAAAAKTGAAAGTEPAAARTRIGALPRASLVPVIRGRSRAADPADADAAAATARAD
jgi:hypothetical protein